MLAGALILASVLLEAESFADRGGWAIDQQFVEQMGSSYLLAHGLGRPVADAKTFVELPAPGDYRLWVRTRDWTAPHGAGRFEVRVDGVRMPREFGRSASGDWRWEDGGTVSVSGRLAKVELHDLTGFEGRVDALCFVPAGEEFREPARRRAIDGTEDCDVAVVGGGWAGICAAVSSARAGAKTVLVQDRPVLGGNASNEIRIPPMGGETNVLGFAADILAELKSAARAKAKDHLQFRHWIDDGAIGAWLAKEPNLSVRLSTRVTEAVTNADGRIAALVGSRIDGGRRTRFNASVFVDCTGDAVLAVMAGAAVRREPETFEETGEQLARRKGMIGGGYGSTNMAVADWTEEESTFPDCPWAIRVDSVADALLDVPSGKEDVKRYAFATGWDWETGFYEDNVKDGERIRDRIFRATYGAWDYLKNRSPDRERYRRSRLTWMAHLLGKRAPVRIEGDYVLTEQDAIAGRRFDDAAVTASWHLDLHVPHPRQMKRYPGEEFRTARQGDLDAARKAGLPISDRHIYVKPFAVPFRCLYSRTCDNLLMAGKDVSATYVAIGSLRVMNTCALAGGVAGRAAAICARTGWTPRELGRDHFAVLKGERTGICGL